MPVHSNIKGNEEADTETCAALQDLAVRNILPDYFTLAYLCRLMWQRRQVLVQNCWFNVCSVRYQELDLKMRRKKPPELSLLRRLLHKFLAARTGYGNFASFHRRLNHIDATLECICGQENTPTHFTRCRRHANQMRKFQNGMKIILEGNCLVMYALRNSIILRRL